MKRHQIPKDFAEFSLSHLPVDASDVEQTIQSNDPLTSVRLHKHKTHHLDDLLEKRVAWTQNGYYLKSRPKFDDRLDFRRGAYYVQESSSMFLSHILSELHLDENPVCLDLCAAPGGKSTILLDHLDGDGLLVANDVIRSRVKTLQENITKWGYSNAVVTNSEVPKFLESSLRYDLILVDAPCSGEGLWRRNLEAIDQWSKDNVQHCALRQSHITKEIHQLIKPGGYLIYSTCTFNQYENDRQIGRLLDSGKYELLHIDANAFPGLLKTKYGFQFIPGLVQGEGFYISVLQSVTTKVATRKKQRNSNPQLPQLSKKELSVLDDFVNDPDHTHYKVFQNEIYHYTSDVSLTELSPVRIFGFGQKMGKLVKNGFRPHPLSIFSLNMMSNDLQMNVSDDAYMAYKERKEIPLDTSHPSKWHMLMFNNLPLAWAKNINGRSKIQWP